MLESQSVNAAFELIKKDKSKILGVTVGQHEVTPGLKIARADARDIPRISFKSATPGKQYIVISLDLDAPYISWTSLGPVLHWIQPGYKVNPATRELTSAAPFVADWIGPAPPPGSGPHRYIFLLYDQPSGFDGKKWAPPGGQKQGNWGRFRYDLTAFEKDAKLGSVLAFNYFCSN